MMSFKSYLKGALLLGLLFVIAACQTPLKNPSNEEQPWRHKASFFKPREASYQAVTEWRYTAKIGLVSEQGRESANMVWQHRDGQNEVRLFGPLGAGQIKIEFDQQQVKLSDSKGVVHEGRSVQALLDHIVGWTIPIDALSRWLFVLPAENYPYRYLLNQDQQLQELEQLGWRIRFEQYRDYQNRLLPRKLIAEHAERGVSVKLIGKSWKWQ